MLWSVQEQHKIPDQTANPEELLSSGKCYISTQKFKAKFSFGDLWMSLLLSGSTSVAVQTHLHSWRRILLTSMTPGMQVSVVNSYDAASLAVEVIKLRNVD